MIDPAQVPPVAADEPVSRYVTQSKQFRPSDGTVKPDAFIPHPHLALSVTRHLQATEEEVWAVGAAVAAGQGKTLYGRAVVTVSDCQSQKLDVMAVPVEGNPNHADVVGWPAAKQDQKAIALVLAAAASFLPPP
jgi:hypothetical protein